MQKEAEEFVKRLVGRKQEKGARGALIGGALGAATGAATGKLEPMDAIGGAVVGSTYEDTSEAMKESREGLRKLGP